MTTDLSVGPSSYAPGGFVQFGRYSNGKVAIQVVDGDEVLYTASVNLSPYGAPDPDDEHVWLKGWSENKGVPKALEKAGICKRTGTTWQTGLVFAELAKLSDKVLAILYPQEVET